MSLKRIHSSLQTKGHLLRLGFSFLLISLIPNLPVVYKDTHFTKEVTEAQKIT